MRLTRQGVRNLDARPVNGHRRIVCYPHLAGPDWHEAGRRYDEYGYEIPVLALRCIKCNEVIP